MNFQSLEVDELKALAAFYNVDPTVANPDNGPTKKELLAALAEEKVTKEDYERFEKQNAEPVEEEVAKDEAVEDVVAEDDAPVGHEDSKDDGAGSKDSEGEVLVKFERKNPTWQTLGYTFTKDHPFKSVPVSVAEELVKRGDVRLALPSEVTDYYN